MERISKNQEVRNLVAQSRYKEALQICKEWKYADPAHRDILQRGYDCLMYPDFYKQIGKDPLIEYNKAIDVLKQVYT